MLKGGQGHERSVSLVPAMLKAFEWRILLTCYHIIPKFKTPTLSQAIDTFYELVALFPSIIFGIFFS